MHSCFEVEIVVIMMRRCHVLNAKWFEMMKIGVGMNGSKFWVQEKKIGVQNQNLVLYRCGGKPRQCLGCKKKY